MHQIRYVQVFGLANHGWTRKGQEVSDDTFTAILDGQRTATTRKDIQVEGVKVGDYLKFTKTKHGVPSEPIYVRVTEVRITDTLTPEEWALPEGYSPKAAAENWKTTGEDPPKPPPPPEPSPPDPPFLFPAPPFPE